MPDNDTHDYYETLQISANAGRFRSIHEAYSVLSDPERRAQYDIAHQQQRQQRWRLVSSGAESENDFESEQIARLTLLEALYTQRRLEPTQPGIFSTELENLIGRPREHLEFTIWYLVQKKLVQRGDNSQLLITADGMDYLEQNYLANLQRRRLTAPTVAG